MSKATSTSNSNSGLMTKVWGPPGWMFLHSITFGYPANPSSFDNETKQPKGTTVTKYRAFFQDLGWVFPCVYCRNSYKQFLKELPLTDTVLSSRDNLVKWLYDIHNKVNNKLQIRYRKATLKNIISKYESFRADCKPGKQTGCTIPLVGNYKIKSTVFVHPDVCLSTLIWLAVCIAILIYLVLNR